MPVSNHTCYGAIFCGQPRERAKAECLVCTPFKNVQLGDDEIIERIHDEVRADIDLTHRRVHTFDKIGDATEFASTRPYAAAVEWDKREKVWKVYPA